MTDREMSDPSEADVKAARDEELVIELLVYHFAYRHDIPDKAIDAFTRALASARAEGEAAGLERAAKIAEAIWLPDKSGSVVAAALRALTLEGKR